MALTYLQLDALTTNATFLSRVRTAVRKHATTLLAGSPTIPQKDWANTMYFSGLRSSQVAANLAPQLCQDPAIIGSTVGDGSDVTDVNLQSAVNTICELYR